MDLSVYFDSFCIIILSWENYSYTKFKNGGSKHGQHVIVAIGLSKFQRLYDIYIYEKIICKVCETSFKV